MCGITGFIGEGSTTLLQAMTTSLGHRGPDGASTYADEEARVFLGHTRLSIVDLADGDQPMWNASKSICVVYNGEIYNAPELRKQLETLGHRFVTDHSDTEVLIHGYEEWGDNLVTKLKGMFAFAIYDISNQVLFLARDHIGEKPLFFAHHGQNFTFASELATLLVHSSISREPDSVGIQKYFAHGYFPSPFTPIKSCQKLHPGSWVRFEIRTGKLHQAKYWSYCDAMTSDQADETELLSEFEHLLDQSISRRLQSDVPVGAFLSSGLDSSLVVDGIQRCSDDTFSTYTIGFDDQNFDEAADAFAFAKSLNLENIYEYVSLDKLASMVSLQPLLFNEPISDASIMPTHLLCANTAQHVKVALSGDGADELFAGYSTFKAMPMARKYNALTPRPIHDFLRAIASELPASYGKLDVRQKIIYFLRTMGHLPSLWHTLWPAPLSPEDVAELFHEKIEIDELFSESIHSWNECDGDDIQRASNYYASLFLPERILTKVDRASMSASLEVRPVFLDIDMVEFSARVPSHLKYSKGIGKVLLRKFAEKRLPNSITKRKKLGFSVPLARLYQEGTLKHPNGLMHGFDLDKFSDLTRSSARSVSTYQYALFAKTGFDRFQEHINTRHQ